MRRLAAALIAIPICAGLAVAQDSGSKNAGPMGRSFTGVLADANCPAASMPKMTPENSWAGVTGSADRSNPAAAPNRARDVNQPPGVDANHDRTTPTQTSGATAGSAHTRKAEEKRPGNSRATATNSTRDLPQATTADEMAAEGDADRLAHPQSPGDAASEMTSNTNYAKWDKSCFVSPSTSTFVLQMPDGRTIRLDDASNQKIVERLQSTGRVQSTNKLLRVRVHGTMDGDVLHITDIQI